MMETERTAGVSYLTCNERHHELMLIEDPLRRGYDHIALEVEDAAALERTIRTVKQAGGQLLGEVYDGEPGIDPAVQVLARSVQVFKLFFGMRTGPALEPGDRPEKFEHASVKALNTPRFSSKKLSGRERELSNSTAAGPPRPS